MQSDRGAWQISSRWWPQYTDAQTDNPATAAKLMWSISKQGSDFNQWDTYKSGGTQRYYDSANGSFPALRPVIRQVIAAGGGTPAAAPVAKPAPKPAPKPTTTTTRPKPTAKPATQPAAKPAATTSGSEIRLAGSYITAYDYWDNNPPGSAAISNPVIHQNAGGTGTFADPITVAVNAGQFPWGTKFYVPNVRAYFIAEDTIGDRPGTPPHLDLWAGGQSSSQSSANNCMSHVTGNYLVIRNPASNYAVVPGPLSANNTCRQLFGDAAVTSGGGSVPAPQQPTPAPSTPKPPVVQPTQPSQPATPSTPTGSSGSVGGSNGGSNGGSTRHHHRRYHEQRLYGRWSTASICRR
jgi:3D (Asp-Asp-Asp) domain-containing protein